MSDNELKLAESMAEIFLDSERLGSMLEARIGDAIEEVMPTRVQIETVTAKKVVTNARPELPQIVQALSMGMSVCLVGPTGGGKSMLCEHVAEAMALDYMPFTCSPDATSSSLLGRLVPDGNEGVTYQPGVFLKAYEQGGLFVGEEFDNSDPSIPLVLNTALASNILPVPNRAEKTVATRHPNFKMIVNMNTWGRGASREYVGRLQQDEALLDRFVGAVFHIDYDAKLERRLASKYPKHGAEILKFVRKLREKAEKGHMRRPVSTRFLINACKWAELKSFDAHKAVDRVLVGWTEDELSKLNVKSMKRDSFGDPNKPAVTADLSDTASATLQDVLEGIADELTPLGDTP